MKKLINFRKKAEQAAVDFLPDADEIERRPLPRSLRLTLHIMLAAVLCFVLLAIFSQVDVNVTTHGRLVTLQPNIVVQPLETAIIQSIDVRVGQVVKKGERLATLDPTFTKADETQLRSRMQSFENEAQSLEAELAGKALTAKPATDADAMLQERLSKERQASYRAQMQKLDETIARLRAAMETNRQDQQGLTARVRVLKEAEAMQSELVAQKFAVRARLLDAQDKRLEVERNLEMAVNRAQELKRELAAAEAEKRSFDTGWRQKMMEEMLSVSRERDAMNEQLQKADRRHTLVTLVSPSDAVVLEVAKLSKGSVIQGAQTLFTLVPLGSDLEAEVQIDSADIGYVKLNDPSHLKLDAFPFQKHGMLSGKLRTISEDAFRRETPSGSGDAYYVARIRLEGTRLKGMPERARLLPGMTLTAEIAVGKRSIMSYILWPLTKALNESIREP